MRPLEPPTLTKGLFRRLLCAVDFSDSSLAGLGFASSLARESGAELTILHVIDWPWIEPREPACGQLPSKHATALAEFLKYLEKSERDRLGTIVPEELRAARTAQLAVRHGKPYVEILRAAEDVRADLIVMGVHGRNVIGTALFGSTTNQVVRRATCPVLTLKQ